MGLLKQLKKESRLTDELGCAKFKLNECEDDSAEPTVRLLESKLEKVRVKIKASLRRELGERL